jgi:hypothetical protein
VQNRASQSRLAASRLADDSDRLSAANGEIDVDERMNRSAATTSQSVDIRAANIVVDAESFQLDQWVEA